MQTHEAYYVVRESRIIHGVGVLPVISEAHKEYNIISSQTIQFSLSTCTCRSIYANVCCVHCTATGTTLLPFTPVYPDPMNIKLTK